MRTHCWCWEVLRIINEPQQLLAYGSKEEQRNYPRILTFCGGMLFDVDLVMSSYAITLVMPTLVVTIKKPLTT